MGFQVKKECCGQCLFGANKIVSDKRKAEILESCETNDRHFICHKASINKEDICCKGFYDTKTSNLIRIAGKLNVVEFVD